MLKLSYFAREMFKGSVRYSQALILISNYVTNIKETLFENGCVSFISHAEVNLYVIYLVARETNSRKSGFMKILYKLKILEWLNIEKSF